MQVGSARGANENRLLYATLRLRPAYAETGGVARLRPLTRSTPRQASFSLHHERSSDATRLRAVRPNRTALGLRVSLMLACYAHTDGVEKQRIR